MRPKLPSAILRVQARTAITNAVSQFFQRVLRRRIALSWLVIACLVAEDVFMGHKPRDVVNLSNGITLLGLGLVVTGLLMRSWAAGVLMKNRELATQGPYSLVRNPLYLGSFLMMFGFCTLLTDYKNQVIILALIVLLYLPQINKEESDLAQAFGPRWTEYKASTPRLLPRRLCTPGMFASWSFRRWARSNEYQAVVAVIAGLMLLKFWHDY